MAIAFVKDASGTGATTTIVITVPAGGFAQGNHLIITAGNADDTFAISTITDSGGNTYTLDKAQVFATHNAAELWSGYLATGLTSGQSVTITLTTGVGGAAVASEFSGLATSSFKDKFAGANINFDTAYDSGATATTTQADELIFGFNFSINTGTTFTPGGTFTETDDQSFFSSWAQQNQYKVVSSTGTYNSTATASAGTTGSAIVGTYKAAGGGTPTGSSTFPITVGIDSSACTVAFDAATESVRTATTDPYTFSHTGRADASGGVQGVIVTAVHGTSSTDHVSSVTYGGLALTRVVTAADTVTEPGRADIWFRGAGLSGKGGTQTVSADLSSATTDDIEFVAITLTTGNGNDIEVIDFDSLSADVANPSVTLQYGNRQAISIAALYGGGAAPTSFTPNGNCTQVASEDLGAFYAYVLRQTTPGTADFAIGGTASSDDVAYVAAAFANKPDQFGVSDSPYTFTVGTAGRRDMPLLDDFNRADGAVGASWTNIVNGLQISSNVAFGNSSSAVNCAAYWNATSFGPDCSALVTIKNLSAFTSDYLRLYLRYDPAADNGYIMQWSLDANGLRIFQDDAGVLTTIAQDAAATYAVNDVIEFEAVGSTLTVYKNGVQALQLTGETTYAGSGRIGLGLRRNQLGVDNFSAGSLGATTPSGSSTFPITFTVGSAGTPKAYGAATTPFTFGVSSAGTPKAYGASAVPVTFGVVSAGSSFPHGASDVPITFTVGSAGTPKAYGAATTPVTFGVSSSGTTKAYGASSSAYTFGVSSDGSSILRRSSDLPITFGVTSSGTGQMPSRIAAAGLAYLFGDVDTAGLFGFSSVDLTFGASTSGTPKAYASASMQTTVDISSAGSVPGSGSATTDITFGVSSTGTPKAYGSSTVAISFGVVSAGQFVPTGASSTPITFGVSSAGTAKAYAASATIINFNVDSSGVGEITTGLFDDTQPSASFFGEPSPSGSFGAPSLTGAMYDEPTPS